MTDVPPTLEAVARAICGEMTNDDDPDWRGYLGEARAALNALKESLPEAVCHSLDFQTGSLLGEAVTTAVVDVLDEIAAEPKPTVEDVLRQHRFSYCCPGVGEAGPAHQATKLREAGLVSE